MIWYVKVIKMERTWSLGLYFFIICKYYINILYKNYIYCTYLYIISEFLYTFDKNFIKFT